MEIPFIEQLKIQAQLLIPLIKGLRAELGEERANTLVYRILGEHWRKFGEEWWRTHKGNVSEKIAPVIAMAAASDALDYEVLKQTPDAYEFNITGCRYAQFYKELGEPELGFLLACGIDVPMAEGYGPEVEFTRTQTIMQGGSHCDFRYRLKKEKEEGQR